MTGREIIKSIMIEKAITNADMARRLSITQAALWDRLNNKKLKDIPFSLLCEMLAVIDYDVLIAPRGKGVKIEGSYASSTIDEKLKSTESSPTPTAKKPLDKKPLDKKPLDKKPLDKKPLDKKPLDLDELLKPTDEEKPQGIATKDGKIRLT